MINLILSCHTIPHAILGPHQSTLGEGIGFVYDYHIHHLRSPIHEDGGVTNRLLYLRKTTEPADLYCCFLRPEVSEERRKGLLRLPCSTLLVLLSSLRGVTFGSKWFRITGRSVWISLCDFKQDFKA